MIKQYFSYQELLAAGILDKPTRQVAATLTALGRGNISRQLVRHWRKDIEAKHETGTGKRPKLTVPEFPPSLKRKGLRIVVVADTQCKPGEDLEYMTWIGKYIADKAPDVVVHIGDNWDCPSLSMYDKGKKSFEGRRLIADLEAGAEGMGRIDEQIAARGLSPRKVFCMGNHEDRIDRLTESLPELDGFVGTEYLPLQSSGWEVVPFLQPIEIGGVFFVHFLANPFSGKPYGGSAANQLAKVGKSFVVGHKQCLDMAIRNTLDGKQQIGIINGACYPFDERYKGPQGNAHFRGLIVLNEVEDGYALPMPVSLEYLRGRYA